MNIKMQYFSVRINGKNIVNLRKKPTRIALLLKLGTSSDKQHKMFKNFEKQSLSKIATSVK